MFENATEHPLENAEAVGKGTAEGALRAWWIAALLLLPAAVAAALLLGSPPGKIIGRNTGVCEISAHPKR